MVALAMSTNAELGIAGVLTVKSVAWSHLFSSAIKASAN